MKRRKFLKCAGHSMAIPGLLGSMGLNGANAKMIKQFFRLASEQNKVLVLVFLDGGNDGLNTVVPLDKHSELNALRPHVVLPESSLIELPESDVAFHPALKDLAELYKESRLGIIQNVGYREQNYSHFRSGDIWISGADSNELLDSGWMGRYLSEIYQGYPEEYPTAEMPDPLAVEIGWGSSLMFQGPNALMSMVMNNPEYFYELLDGVEAEAPDTLAGDKLRFVRLIAKQSQQYGRVVVDAAQKAGKQIEYPGDPDSAYPNSNHLGQKLKIVSRLISGGLSTPIYMVRIGGFDTHEGQVIEGNSLEGTHNELLKEVNDAIFTFMKRSGSTWSFGSGFGHDFFRIWA